jgi:hypothetical protein
MGMSRFVARGCILALMALSLGACAQLRENAAVGIGTAAYRTEMASGYARLYRPYAQMAALAYTNQDYLTPGSLCPNADKLGQDPAEDSQRAAAWTRQLRSEKWQCLFGRIGYDNCPHGVTCVGGLEFHVWRRDDCSEAVIAFRGSDARDIGDWLSNFRWFIASPLIDQYDEVRNEIRGIVGRIAAAGCRHPRIIATGHSLGGGLAQHAAYASPRIDYVYAFDPSPVTGYFDVPWATRQEAIQHFGTDRVYEAGEILSLPRYIMSGIFPTSSCRPRVRVVRFATIPGASLVERHRITTLTEGLIELSRLPHSGPLPTAYAAARNCDFAGTSGGI